MKQFSLELIVWVVLTIVSIYVTIITYNTLSKSKADLKNEGATDNQIKKLLTSDDPTIKYLISNTQFNDMLFFTSALMYIVSLLYKNASK